MVEEALVLVPENARLKERSVFYSLCNLEHNCRLTIDFPNLNFLRVGRN